MTVVNARMVEGQTFADFNGTAFPAALWSGRTFYRSDLRTLFVYDLALNEWLSAQVYEFPFGYQADLAATAYVKFNEQTGFAPFVDGFGWFYAARTRVVAMTLIMPSVGSCTIQVFASPGGVGAGVTDATLSLSSQIAKADENMMSAAIDANTPIGVKVTAGTLEGPARGIVKLRRAELPT